jgi:diacylglycerol kinase
MLTDILGVGQRLYAPLFDTTKYDLNGIPEVIKINEKKMKEKLSMITSDTSTYWWVAIILILIVVIIIPICLYAYASTMNKID